MTVSRVINKLKETIGFDPLPLLSIVLLYYIRITCRFCDQYLDEHAIRWTQIDCCWNCANQRGNSYLEIFK